MKNKRQKISRISWGRTVGVALGLLAQIYSPRLIAEPRSLSAVPASGSITAKMESSIAAAIVQPSPLKPEAHLYNQYVADADGRIYWEYRNRWDYQDMQANYSSLNVRDQRHITPGSLDFYDKAQTEDAYRRAFATQVLQLRMQKGLENYMKTWRGLKDVRSIESTLKVLQAAQVQSISLAPASPSARPNPFVGSIRVGYDIFTDFSKLEYSCPALDFGFYQAVMLGTGRLSDRSFFSQVTIKPANAVLPTPTFRYRFESRAMEIGISKTINKDVSASLSTVQANRPGTDTSYGVSLAYRF